MTRLTRRRLIGLSAAVGLTALAGCGDEDLTEGPGPQAPGDDESETPENGTNETEGGFQNEENETESGNETDGGNLTESGNMTEGGNETESGNETEDGNETDG